MSPLEIWLENIKKDPNGGWDCMSVAHQEQAIAVIEKLKEALEPIAKDNDSRWVWIASHALAIEPEKL